MNTTPKTLQQKADEARNMCKLKGNTMLDNSECVVAFELAYPTMEAAQQAVNFFIEKAKSVETEPCLIHYTLEPDALLKMRLEFCCQAEAILFQMAVR